MLKPFKLAALLLFAFSTAAVALPVGVSVSGTIWADGDEAIATNAPGFAAAVPGGASWDTDPTVAVPPGNSRDDSQTPFFGTSLENVNDYYAALVGSGANDGSTVSPVTLTLGAGVRFFDLLWGSVDDYNTLTFTTAGGPLAVTGTHIAAFFGLPTPSTSNGNYNHTALLRFTFDDDVTALTFASTKVAFEFAIAPVPLPAAGWMLLIGVGGLAAMRRRSAAA